MNIVLFLFMAMISLLFFNQLRPIDIKQYQEQNQQIISQLEISKERQVLVFWQLSCGPCIKELKYLNNQTNLKVIAINLDSKTSLEETIKQLEFKIDSPLRFTVVQDSEHRKLANVYEVKGVPFSILFENQQALEMHQGFYKYSNETITGEKSVRN